MRINTQKHSSSANSLQQHIFMLLKCIYFTHTNSLIQNVPMILLMNLQSTVHILSNYIPNLLKSVLIIVPSQERSMYQYFEVAGFINRVKNAMCMIQSLLIQ